MASTTTNLGLTKPAYSDDADISDINGNMDMIDAEAGMVRANVAANYDSSETYAVGDYCLHDGSLYKCSTAISSPEAWTAGHWTQIKITGELSTLNGKTTPEALTVVLANNTSTMTRYHAQRIGKMVWFSVNFTTSVQLNAESALFRIDTSGGTNVVPITQNSTKIIHFSNNEMKFYTLQKSDNKYYVVPASQINANSAVILSGCFVCE